MIKHSRLFYVVTMLMLSIVSLNAQEINAPVSKVWNDNIPTRFNMWDNSPYFSYYNLGKLWSEKTGIQSSCALIYDNEQYYLHIELCNYFLGFYVLDSGSPISALFIDKDGMSIKQTGHAPIPVAYHMTDFNHGYDGLRLNISIGNWGISEPPGTVSKDIANHDRLAGKYPKYTTSMLFAISDIDEFVNHEYVGFSICDDAIKYMPPAGDKYITRFNSHLRKAVKSVQKQIRRQMKGKTTDAGRHILTMNNV